MPSGRYRKHRRRRNSHCFRRSGRYFLDVGKRFFRDGYHLCRSVMAQHTRVVKDGSFVGGPVYYIQAAFKGRFGRFLAGFFSVALILALGFMEIWYSPIPSGIPKNAFHVSPLAVGICVAVVAGFIFLGGIRRIARFTEKIVPLMALLYIVGCLIIYLRIFPELRKLSKIYLQVPFLPALWPEARWASPFRRPCATALPGGFSPTKQVWDPRLMPTQPRM